MAGNPYEPPRTTEVVSNDHNVLTSFQRRIHSIYVQTFDTSGCAFAFALVIPLLLSLVVADTALAVFVCLALIAATVIACIFGIVLGVILWRGTGSAQVGIFRHMVLLVLCLAIIGFFVFF